MDRMARRACVDQERPDPPTPVRVRLLGHRRHGTDRSVALLDIPRRSVRLLLVRLLRVAGLLTVRLLLVGLLGIAGLLTVRLLLVGLLRAAGLGGSALRLVRVLWRTLGWLLAHVALSRTGWIGPFGLDGV